MGLLGLTFFVASAGAQQAPKMVRGQVTNEQGAPIPNVQVAVKGTTTGTSTNSEGNYFVRATDDQVLQYRLIGFAPEERLVGQRTVINVQLRRTVTKLNEVVTTALGQTATAREIGTLFTTAPSTCSSPSMSIGG